MPLCRNARAGVDGDAGDLFAPELHLAGVQARANLETERLHGVAYPTSTADRSSRAIKRGEKAVTRSVDLPPAPSVELHGARAS